MGSGKGSSSSAPQYTSAEIQDMINQQSGINSATAQQTAQLNRVNQYTPYGTSLYYQDPNNANSWTQATTLSPAEQNLMTQQQSIGGTANTLANNQLYNAAGTLSTPINTDYNNVRDQYISSQMGLLSPQLTQSKEALQSQLQNQGVPQGSTAWNNAMRSYNNQVSSQYANILSNAQSNVNSAIQGAESLRDQPINEINALKSMGQVSYPSFSNVPQTQVQSTNTSSDYSLQSQAAQNAYNQQVQSTSSALGGLGSLAGSLGSAAIIASALPTGGASGAVGGGLSFFSDRRLKTDEKTVGKLMLPTGDLPIKTFRFKGDPVRRMGFVAQDVEQHDPAAVYTHPVTGVKGVNYARVLLGAHHHGMKGGGGRGVRSAA